MSNKGFIRQMAAPGTTIILGKYISAWGGIQSAGQTVGQIVSHQNEIQVDSPFSNPLSSSSNTQLKSLVAKSRSTSSGSTSSSASSSKPLLQDGIIGSLPSSSLVWASVCCNPLCLYTCPKLRPLSFEVSISTHTVCEFISVVGSLLVTLTNDSWFVLGQIFASVALQELSANDPYDFRVPIYTQVSNSFR